MNMEERMEILVGLWLAIAQLNQALIFRAWRRLRHRQPESCLVIVPEVGCATLASAAR